MADLPQPLRRKPVLKAADSRYVSLFSDADNKSDITMNDGHKGLLPKSTKLYEVGVDNLTLSLNGLSMLTPSSTEPVIMEILGLRTYQGQQPNDAAGNWEAFPADFQLVHRERYQLLDTEVYTTYSQVMDRLTQIGDEITGFINAGLTTNYDWEFATIRPFIHVAAKHLQFVLHNSGHLEIRGTKTFWSYFCIHFPNPHYRSIMFGPSYSTTLDQRVMSLNPRSGAIVADRIVFEEVGGVTRAFTRDWDVFDNLIDPQFEADVSNTAQSQVSEEAATINLILTLRGNLYSSLDERVCIEVCTSLPLTHSALVEDNREGPDYSLGRFMFNSGLRVGFAYGNESHEVHGPSTYELMNSEKRVMYHRLLPQEKVSVLRIQMYIRRRVYDVTKDKWKMRSDPLPTAPSDWWHCRLHFRELHETAISQKRSPYQ